MTYNFQMPSDPQMFPQHRLNIRVDLENLSEILETKDLKATDEAKEYTDEKEHDCSVEPREEF